MTEAQLVSAPALRSFVQRVLEASGVPGNHAAIIAEAMVWADLRGLEPHGVLKLPLWVTRMQAGSTPPDAQPTALVQTDSTALLDAGGAVGQLAGVRAMELAVEKARTHRVGVVVVRDSSSFGALGYYPTLAIRHNLIGLAITNSMPLLAPTGGAAKLLGNQAYAIGCPAGAHHPLLLDTSNSATSTGRIKLALELGETIAPGLALDPEGRPTVDPAAALEGLLLPAAGHKGYGLALMWEILTGVLAGLAFGPTVGGPEATDRRSEIAGFMLALDPTAFIPLDAFTDRVDQLIDQIHAVPKAPGVERVYAPGERGYELAAKRECEGIPLSARRTTELRRLAKGLGVQPL